MATDAAPAPRYSLLPGRLPAEDILFCVDVDLEARAEMKSAASAASSGSTSTASPQPTQPAGAGGAPAAGPRTAVRRMDAIKQALLLFVHSKLTMCPDHRYAFGSLGDTFSMVSRFPSPDPFISRQHLVGFRVPCTSRVLDEKFRERIFLFVQNVTTCCLIVILEIRIYSVMWETINV
jgi:hypothetical protein